METQLKKIEGHPDMIRDSKNFAILNTDTSAINRHNKYLLQKQKDEEYTQQLNNLKDEICQLKEMLRTLLKVEK